MSKLKLVTILGTRPEIIRLSKVIKKFDENLKNFIKFFTEIFFIDTEHVNNFTSNYKCEKIFVLIKK